MKPLADQNHYEVLEVEPDAEPEEIDRAYRVARAAFAEESVGLYSVYGELDALAIRERLEAAHQVLSDAEARRAYDETLAREGAGSRPEQRLDLDITMRPEERERIHDPTQELPLADELEDLEAEESGEFDGARLRRSRLRRGLELDQIAGITKINPRYVRCLEDESFEDLPAPVYVRGFVAAYARCVGLDPRRVAPSYMQRYHQSREEPERSGPLGRS